MHMFQSFLLFLVIGRISDLEHVVNEATEQSQFKLKQIVCIFLIHIFKLG